LDSSDALDEELMSVAKLSSITRYVMGFALTAGVTTEDISPSSIRGIVTFTLSSEQTQLPNLAIESVRLSKEDIPVSVIRESVIRESVRDGARSLPIGPIDPKNPSYTLPPIGRLG
jgi:hypothetical protein